ncbi:MULTISPECIES: hypothetical protein [unclassified Roseateles]|uniref:hypothetical protein n=1 Tax=unclassified Roseateles TaxID=2626991 RepID=UPI0006FEDC82|nr:MULTISPECIES: hypothetical protein [unclassified Roseateles]KQW49637.1 hypothetical protein ASC81_25430 [Pelomonas sp. Root405]KRA76096.1 hypothetical protein ASD88_25380 [Pelomonas sp. Root662]
MIGVIPSPTSPLFSTAPLRPLTAPAAAGHAGGAAWLDGLGAGGPASLRADVAADQRGLSVQQHAERVLAALVA